MHFEKIERVTNKKVVTKKAYCTLSGGRYPDSTDDKVIPEILKANQDANVLAFNASTYDLTNISPWEYLTQQASLSSYNSVTQAKNALNSSHPNLKKVIIPERSPCYDNLEWLNNFANSELHKAKE